MKACGSQNLIFVDPEIKFQTVGETTTTTTKAGNATILGNAVSVPATSWRRGKGSGRTLNLDKSTGAITSKLSPSANQILQS